MRASRVSLCYYPTTVILVDDQKNFLDSVSMGLKESIPHKCYTDPHAVIEFFKNYKPDHFINHCVTFDEDSAQVNLLVRQVSLQDIHSEIYNSDRFKQISLLVADYFMPGRNGLECCDAISDKFIQKLLLTGDAQDDLAIEAFNKKRINQFIRKGTSNLTQVLNDRIEELQLNYFLQLSDYLRGTMSNNDDEYVLGILDDPIFARFFYDLCEENQIVEYYILDNQGSFLLLDDKAQAYWLLVKDEVEMQSLSEFAKMEEALPSLISALETRSHLPYFHTDEDLQTPAKWEAYLHPATLLEGKQKYYYSFLTDVSFKGVESKHIVSLQQYLKTTA
ncbi:MAG: hypothetical protein QM752_07255 [Gammaproteobacteria bacterium]